MKFWSKKKDADTESARKIPQEEQNTGTQDSTVVTVPTEDDYDVVDKETPSVDNDNIVKEEEIIPLQNPSQNPSQDVLNTNANADENLEKEEHDLRVRLEQIEDAKLKKQQEQELKDSQSETQNNDSEYSSQHLIYLTDAECLREVLKKLDHLIIEINELKNRVIH